MPKREIRGSPQRPVTRLGNMSSGANPALKACRFTMTRRFASKLHSTGIAEPAVQQIDPTHLLILGGSMTALAVLRDAHTLGLSVTVVDAEPTVAFSSRYGSKRLIGLSVSEVCAVAREVRCDGTLAVIATSDAWLRVLIEAWPWFDAAGWRILHHHPVALEDCLDKRRFAELCARNGFSIPATWIVGAEQRPDDLKLPVILRAAASQHDVRDGSSLPKALEIRDESSLQEWLRLAAASRVPVVVSRSLLDRPLLQLSVPYVRIGGQVEAFVAVKVRPVPSRCQIGSFVQTHSVPSALALVRRVVSVLDGDGFGEVEILHDLATGENYLIEVNPRPWLQYSLAPRLGFPMLRALLTGKCDTVSPENGFAWINLDNDLVNAFFSVGNARTSGVWGYLTQLRKVRATAVFDFSDPRPAIARAYRLLKRQFDRRCR